MPSLGRNLSEGSSITIANIIAPYTMFEPRLNQVDLRFSKIFRFGGTRIQGMFDLYNLLNQAAILTENTRYGSAWRTPTSVLDARLFKFGVQVNF